MKLPTIDVSAFAISSELAPNAQKQSTAKEVYNACVDTGFFLIKGYESVLPQEKISHLFELMNAYFQLPLEEKKKFKALHNRGYFSFGDENLTTIHPHLNESFVNTELGDFKEGIDIGREIDPSSPEYNLPFRHPNLWPDPALLPPNWKEDILDYFYCADKLGRVLMRIFATALNLQENWFENKLDKPMTMLRLLHYPPAPVDVPRFGCGAHSDYGCCTILAQDDTGGLQLLSAKNEWIDIPYEPNTLVVNIGDMMQRWTNNKFKSTIHRVLNPSTTQHRFSVPFFFDPNYDTVVECIESCCGDDCEKLYPAVVFGDHLQNMYSATFTTQQQKTADA